MLCLCRRLFVVRSHAHVRAHLKQDASSDVLGTYGVYFVLSPLGGLVRFPYAQGNLPLFFVSQELALRMLNLYTDV